MLNGMITASGSLDNGSTTESSTKRQSLAMSEHSSVTGTPEHIREWLTSSLPASPVNRSASPGNEQEQTTTAICGPRPSESFAQFDRGTASWRTYQASLIQGISTRYSGTWPKAGMMLAGACYRRLSWERRIDVIGSGLLPTPRANKIGGVSSPGWRPTLEQAVKWPTPQARDGKRRGAQAKRFWNTDRSNDLPDAVAAAGNGGQLNPTWVEWMMNWPIYWTRLEPIPREYYDDWKNKTMEIYEARTESHPPDKMRELWYDADPSETPYGPEQTEQRTGEHYGSVSEMPFEDTRRGGGLGTGAGSGGDMRDMRENISTEAPSSVGSVREQRVCQQEGEIISRTALGIENRVDRLKAIGNGQVPIVAAAAWRLLTEGE